MQPPSSVLVPVPSPCPVLAPSPAASRRRLRHHPRVLTREETRTGLRHKPQPLLRTKTRHPGGRKLQGKAPFVCCSGVGRSKPRCFQTLWDARRGAELQHVHVHQLLAHPAPNQSTGCVPGQQSCAISTGGAGGGSTAPADADVWEGSRRQPQNALSIPPMCRALGSPSSCTRSDRGTGSRSFSSPHSHFQAFFVPSMPCCSCQEGVPVSPKCPVVPIPPPARPFLGHHHGEVPHPPAGLLFCCFIHLENCLWS